MPNTPKHSLLDHDYIKYQCIVCPHETFKQSFPGLIQCINCNFITANISLTAEDIRVLYGAEYFSGEEYADYIGDKKVIQRNLSNWLNIIRKYRESGILVEIGSAYGFFLELASKHFQVSGYEVSESAATYSNNVVNVKTYNMDFLDDRKIDANSVDVAVMWDVIEHLPNPSTIIEKLQQVLKPNGHLFITTGDIDSKLAKSQGSRWRMIHPPSHLQYFSKNTLTKLFNSKGFEVIDVKYPGYWRSLGQILHGLFILGSNDKESVMYKLLRNVVPKRFGLYLNTYDIMLVTAKLTGKK